MPGGGNRPDLPFYERRRVNSPVLSDARQRRTLEMQQHLLSTIQADKSVVTISEAAKAAGITRQTIKNWCDRDPDFKEKWEKAKQFLKNRKKALQIDRSLIYDPDAVRIPDPMDFAEWRRTYIGRQTPPHHEALVKALEDETNSIVIMLGPPGMGKDTTAGDLALMSAVYNPGLRIAWLMESSDFSVRRIKQRIVPYLTDERAYDHAPPGEDSVKPEGSLIEDFGPFKAKTGMVYPDGEKVKATRWTDNEVYFLNSKTKEADPNLWATGIHGSTYGSRIELGIVSDPFTKENQTTDLVMGRQLDFITGTFLSRLDDYGRALFLGTRIKDNDNWERLIDMLVEDAPILYQDGHMTKYANGVCVIIIPAIQVDDDGNEVSYWPEKFPLESRYVMPWGEELLVKDLTPQQMLELAEKGARRRRGLYEIRDRDPIGFETMYQQSPPRETTGDFSEAVLEAAEDETRTFGAYRPSEVLISGVDPARKAGAASATVAVDVENQTITVIDAFYGENLGIIGIKQKLIMRTLALWNPLYLGYEINKEAAVLDDSLIVDALEQSGTTVYRHTTHSGNRSKGPFSVASLSFYMRTGTIRFPTQTAEDRRKTDQLKAHFRNWDSRSHAQGRTRPGQARHNPDDLAFAVWIACVKAVQYLERGAKQQPPSRPVPRAVKQRWERMRNQTARLPDQRNTRHERPDIMDLVTIAGSHYAD